MRAKECVIRCHCERGAFLMTSLRSEEQKLPVAFWVTEDEHLLFRGICSKCGEELMFRIAIMELFLSVPGRIFL